MELQEVKNLLSSLPILNRLTIIFFSQTGTILRVCSKEKATAFYAILEREVYSAKY